MLEIPTIAALSCRVKGCDFIEKECEPLPKSRWGFKNTCTDHLKNHMGSNSFQILSAITTADKP